MKNKYTGARICLVSHLHPAGNPRLVRDAIALAGAGFEVIAVTTRLVERLVPFDNELATQDWKHLFVDLTKSSPGSLRWQFVRARHKVCLALARQFPIPILVDRGCAYAGPEMAKLAAGQRASLYIAHTHAALPAAAWAARRTGAKLGFDAEDLLAESSDEPTRLLRALEERLVQRCEYISTMSCAAAMRLQQTLRLASPPLVLHNTARLAERAKVPPPSERPISKTLRIYWFGQTIGAHSCADQVLRALPLLSIPAKVVLRGNPRSAYVAELRVLAASLGLRDCLEIQPLASPTQMVRLAAEHDVLLGSQPSAEPFHQMAIGNKVFTGMMAGLVLALTDTVAHRLLSSDLRGCGFLFPNNDHHTLARHLEESTRSGEKLLYAKSTAWQIAEDRFCWDKEKDRLIAVVNEALRK